MEKYVSVLFAAAMLILFSGCSYYGLSGGGPLTQKQAFARINRSPEILSKQDSADILQQDYEQIGNLSGIKMDRERDGAPERIFDGITMMGTTVKGPTDARFSCVPFVAIYHNNFLTDLSFSGSNGSKIYTHRKDFVGPLFPFIWLLWFHDQEAYNMSTSKEVSNEKFRGVGLLGILYNYHRALRPADASKIAMPEPMYDYKSGHTLAWGLFSVGQVNHRRYLQLA